MSKAKSDERTGIVAVTGASRGLGAAIALELAERGFLVGCLSRRGQGPEDLEVPAGLRSRMVHESCDVTDGAGVARALARLSEQPGGLRAVVNNAGVHKLGPSKDFTTEDFEWLLQTNAVGTFTVCREAYPHLLASGGGAIINIGSFFERLGVPGNACYSASKAAVGALTRALATEWARDCIAVINVAPGYIETDLNRDYLNRPDVKAYFERRVPIGRPAQPEEVAGFVASLLSETSMLLTGETIYLDGGHSIDHGRI